MPSVSIPGRVLVTGASGFLASHISRTLLSRGHVVVGTVRSREKGEYLEKLHQNPAFSFSVVEDITQPGAVDHLLDNIDCVHHTASPFHFSARDPQEIIAPAVNGTLGVLRSIKNNGRNVDRVIITSSVAAIITPKEGPYTFTEDEWNTFSPQEVSRLGNEASGSDKYQTGKVLSERAAWNFVDKEKRNGFIHWDLVTICSPFIFGPVIHQVPDISRLNTSSAFFHSWITSPPPKEQIISPFSNLVDVRDVALAHVLAMESKYAGGERFIVSNGPFCVQDIYDDLHKAGVTDIPHGYPGFQTPQEEQCSHDGSKAVRMLGLNMTSRSKMVCDAVASLRERFGKKLHG